MMEIIGAKTEPMKYRKLVMSSIGNSMALTVPMTATKIPMFLPEIRDVRDSAEIPAE